MDAFATLYTYYLSINQRAIMRKIFFSGRFREKALLIKRDLDNLTTE